MKKFKLKLNINNDTQKGGNWQLKFIEKLTPGKQLGVVQTNKICDLNIMVHNLWTKAARRYCRLQIVFIIYKFYKYQKFNKSL